METKYKYLTSEELEVADRMDLLQEQLSLIKTLTAKANDMSIAIDDPHDFRRIYLKTKDFIRMKNQYMRAVRIFTRRAAENSDELVALIQKFESKVNHES